MLIALYSVDDRDRDGTTTSVHISHSCSFLLSLTQSEEVLKVGKMGDKIHIAESAVYIETRR